MGQIKKLLALIDRYERLPDGNFKESIKKEIEYLKELCAEVETLKKQKSRLDANIDDCMITYVEDKENVNTH